MLNHALRFSVLARNSVTFTALNSAASQGFARRRKDAKGFGRARRHQGIAHARTRQPDCICPRAECNAGAGQPMGTRRGRRRPQVNTPKRRSTQAADFGGEEGDDGGGLRDSILNQSMSRSSNCYIGFGKISYLNACAPHHT